MVSWQLFPDFILENLVVIHNFYNANHVFNECEVKLFGTVTTFVGLSPDHIAALGSNREFDFSDSDQEQAMFLHNRIIKSSFTTTMSLKCILLQIYIHGGRT